MRLISYIHVSAALLSTMVHAIPIPVEAGIVNTETAPISSVAPPSSVSVAPPSSVEDTFTTLPSSTLTADDPEDTDTDFTGGSQASGNVEEDSGISGGCIVS